MYFFKYWLSWVKLNCIGSILYFGIDFQFGMIEADFLS